ncbi:MAG: hypothetical protein JWS10_59 [Cypionkella sp.]|uniref:hypothetical protein n=1 Tax=Cypionkella sp. TaxID=2811411 RepID=UPI00260D0D16|nr:hypothetical protein [Cypionkella sp.]MDB5657444.1 hypothetical protein [Cypionkella sp.]MDB5664023.1 hypothetical protein [Cypionkella sp.]
MTQTLSQPPSRRTSYVAIVLFALAYIGVMAIIFAPEGSLSNRAPLIATEQTE